MSMKDMVQSESLMTKKDLCNYLKCSLGKVNDLMKFGQIQYIKFGRCVKFRRVDIDDFLYKNLKKV
jgi:excisionase family DNA binding protein